MVGSPITHSLSPVLHRAAYDALGLDWSYDPVVVHVGGLAAFVAGLAADWIGLSVTMPLKIEALQLADEVDPAATRVGAANTLVRVDDRWRAYNTDVRGMQRVLCEHGLDQATSVTIVGAGATARSVLASLGGAAEVTVVARDPSRAETLLSLATAAEVRVVQLDDERAFSDALAAPLVINTTPSGALDETAISVPRMLAGRSPGCWLDVVYDPWPTPVAASWKRCGGALIGGLELLLAQAYLQVELMTRQLAPEPEMRSAGERALTDRRR